MVRWPMTSCGPKGAVRQYGRLSQRQLGFLSDFSHTRRGGKHQRMIAYREPFNRDLGFYCKLTVYRYGTKNAKFQTKTSLYFGFGHDKDRAVQLARNVNRNHRSKIIDHSGWLSVTLEGHVAMSLTNNLLFGTFTIPLKQIKIRKFDLQTHFDAI